MPGSAACLMLKMSGSRIEDVFTGVSNNAFVASSSPLSISDTVAEDACKWCFGRCIATNLDFMFASI
ncbi:hypothetical protein KCU61_g556, partial [Aureobasidium melanogenum]